MKMGVLSGVFFRKEMRLDFDLWDVKCLFRFEGGLCLGVGFLCGRGIYTCGLGKFVKKGGGWDYGGWLMIWGKK